MAKILMLITNLIGGGADRIASVLSLNLAPDVKRRIITLTNEISYPSNLPPLSMNFNISDEEAINMFYVAIIGSIKYRKILRTYKPDVSMSFNTLDNFINIFSNIGNKKTKVIVSVRISLSMKFRKSVVDRFTKFLIKNLYNKSDLVIAISRGVRDELIRDFKINPGKIRLLYNPIDKEQIQYLAGKEVNDEWFDGELPIIINMGRLTQAKGQWHLIRAFSKVLRKKKECKLVILGKGALNNYLEKLVIDLGLTSYVKFLGWQDNPFKYISKASIFVFPSLREAFGNALIEAMVCGCPVIATDCKYGPSEILGNGKFGILIPPMDGRFYRAQDPLTQGEHFLADKIIMLLEDNNLRASYSNKGTERAKDFDMEQNIREYENIIRD